MLEEYKKLYISKADLIPGWKDMSKSELCNKYIEYENTDKSKSECYLSAIVCNYWHAIDKYYSQSYSSASPEDCYEWLIHAITYALNARKWLDPKNKLYDDPNGPDKVINRCIKSTRLIHYQASNRLKRRINYNMSSLDSLQEEYQDLFTATVWDFVDETRSDMDNLILEAFNHKDYFLSFFLDGIVNADVFEYVEEDDKTYSSFSSKKLVSHIRHIDDAYCFIFAKRFNLPIEKVKKGASYCTKLSSQRLYTKIRKTAEDLRIKHRRGHLYKYAD